MEIYFAYFYWGLYNRWLLMIRKYKFLQVNMSDKLISKINEGLLMLFCILPFVICGYIINDISTKIAISVFGTIAVICYIIRILIDCGYNINVLKDYELSQGAINLLVIQYSALSIIEIKYHIFTSLWQSSDFLSRFGLFFVVFLYLVMNITIWRGFVVRKKDKPKDVNIPEYNEQDIPKDAACILSALDSFEEIVSVHQKEMKKIDNLKVPTPKEFLEDDNTYLATYIQSLSNIPREHPEFAALEQFMLMIADNEHLHDWGEELSRSLGDMVKDGWSYAEGLKDILIEAKNSVVDYFSNPTEETSDRLLKNIEHYMQHDFHGAKFYFDLEHANGIYRKIGTILKHSVSDTGKGMFETFFDKEALHKLNKNFTEQLPIDLDDYVPSVNEIDIWNPDFDANFHFPMFSTAIELYRLSGKYADGDVDMGKAATKSGVKIGMTASGAYLGSVIGSIIFPGAGTAIGAMIGSWLGRFGANKINKAETKKLQGDLEDQIKVIENMGKEAQQKIERYWRQTTENITNVAKRESDNFEELKHESPLSEYSDKSILQAVSIIVKEYLYDFIYETENKYGTSKETEISQLRKYLPSADQIKNYPKESLGLILSSQKYIRDNFKEDYRYNFEMINKICISSIIQNISLTKILQTLWYNQVFNDYKTSIANIMRKSNNLIKEYVDNVDSEKRAIDVEVEKAEKIKDELQKEIKTN